MKTMDELIAAVNGAVMFSKLDLRKAFHQVKIAEESQHLTTIATPFGMYRYKRLHMGITSASEIFTEIIRKMLEDLPGCVNMTDDILVFGRTPVEHHANLRRVLKRLEERGVTLNVEKSQFCKTELTFYGLRFTDKGVSPTEDRVRAVRETPNPESAAALNSFLSGLNWSSRFLPDVCTASEPLWPLARGVRKWEWGEAEQAAFDKLKGLITTQCLGYFNPKWETILVVDASPVGVGAVLNQYHPRDPRERHTVACMSRLLTDVERRYTQCEKEALAVVWGRRPSSPN
jgi:hypothetical protein